MRAYHLVSGVRRLGERGNRSFSGRHASDNGAGHLVRSRPDPEKRNPCVGLDEKLLSRNVFAAAVLRRNLLLAKLYICRHNQYINK